MKITDFENSIERKILNRGEDYYTSDYIVEFEKVSSSLFKGVVRGTRLYNVLIEVRKDLEISKTSCDCPYAYGTYCKHKVALMYMIEDLDAYEADYEVSGNMQLVEQRIQEMSKKELKDMIKSMCIANRDTLNHVLVELGIDDDIYNEEMWDEGY